MSASEQPGIGTVRSHLRAVVTHAMAFAAGAFLVYASLIAAQRFASTEGGLCMVAGLWRDRVEAFEVTTNQADANTAPGRTRMQEAYGAVANVTLPPQRRGRGELVAAMRSWNLAAETWLSKVYALTGFTSSSGTLSAVGQQGLVNARKEEEDARVGINQSSRDVNSLLVATCGLSPIELYKK